MTNRTIRKGLAGFLDEYERQSNELDKICITEDGIVRALERISKPRRSAARRFMTGEADWLRWFMLGMGMLRGVRVK